MSAWQYGEHILAIYECEQGYFLMFGDTFNLWKTIIEYRGQNFFEDTVRNIIHVEHRRICNVYKLRTEVFCGQIPSLVEIAKFTSRSAVRFIPTIPSVLQIKLTNHIDLCLCKNINQSEREGQILTLASARRCDSSPR